MSAGAGHKTCTKCGETKALDAFAKHSRNKTDGRQARCKACNREYRQANAEKISAGKREYCQANAEKVAEGKRRYAQANAEKLAAYQREYLRANAEKISERQRRYAQANSEKLAAYRRGYTQANSEKIAERGREYRQANREKIAERDREYRRANPDVGAATWRRRRARKASVPHEPYSRAEIFAAYGGTCAYCDAPAEHLDHVVALSRGGADAPHNLLPACAPCNLSKGAKSLAEWVATT